MHPLFDRLENIRLLDAADLNTVVREELLWQCFQCVVWTVKLFLRFLEQLLGVVSDLLRRRRPARIDRRQQRTVKLLLAELAVVLAVEASIGQFAEWTVALVSASF